MIFWMCILVLSPDGEQIESDRCDPTPIMTLQVCDKQLHDLGPIKALGGRAVIPYCRRLGDDEKVET